jgi:hypothetical protein
MSFNDEVNTSPAPRSASSPGMVVRVYFYLFVLIAFAHEAYHLSTGEAFFWKIGEGTVRLTSMVTDHGTTLGPIVLLGAVLMASGCCHLLDATGSRRRPTLTPSPEPAQTGHAGQSRPVPQLLP